MKRDLLRIVNHYGILSQLKYIHSEYFELDEAILNAEYQRFEGKHCGIPEYCKTHIAEEVGDCYVMLEQIRHYYNISNDNLKEIMDYKINRQLERIEKENER